MRFLLNVLVILSVAVVCGWACSCIKKHPQEHFCSADFVILAQVKRASRHDKADWSRAYKVRIKKDFKVTPKAREALSYGRILTPANDGTCGIQLKPGRRYVLTGNVRGGKPWINICNWYHDWDKMTPVQRKGFRKLYKQGCDCKVMDCHWWSKCPPSSNTCAWDTAFQAPDCQGLHAVCMRGQQGACQWVHSRSYRTCSKRKAQPVSVKRTSYDFNSVLSE